MPQQQQQQWDQFNKQKGSAPAQGAAPGTPAATPAPVPGATPAAASPTPTATPVQQTAQPAPSAATMAYATQMAAAPAYDAAAAGGTHSTAQAHPETQAPNPFDRMNGTSTAFESSTVQGLADQGPINMQTGQYADGGSAIPISKTQAAAKLNDFVENNHVGGDGKDGTAPDDLWANMLAQYDQSLKDKIQGTYSDEANSGRRMAEMNALGGGHMGGAFAGGVAQTAIGGEQTRLKARSDHAKQGLEMKMARLQQLIKQAEAGKDRDLQRELEAESDKTQMEIAGMSIDAGLPAPSSGGNMFKNINEPDKWSW